MPITNITQTFSEFFQGNSFANGFAALASLAQPGATTFSRATALIDPATGMSYFDEVMVWQDSNQEGVSQPGELKSLTALGITSINLDGSPNTGETIDGSAVTSNSSFSSASDGGQIASVDLQNDATGDISQTANGGVVVTDVFLINAQTVVNGGTGFNIAKVTGDQGMTIDLAKDNLQEVIGGSGDSVLNAPRTFKTRSAAYRSRGAELGLPSPPSRRARLMTEARRRWHFLPDRSGLPRLNTRRARHKMLALLLASLIPVASAKSATSAESCFYPNIGTIFTLSGLRLGEFHLALDPPDYSDPQSVQNHLSYSAILSRLLEQALPEQTGNFCHAEMNANYFPDLYVYLTRQKSDRDVETDRVLCSHALLDVLANLQPDEKAVAAAATQQADQKVQSWSDPTDPLSVLLRALSRVYFRESLFWTLLGSDPARLRSISSTAFLSWLDRQRAIKRDALTPIRICAGSWPSWQIAGGDADVGRLPRSNVVPPGTFDLSIVPSSTVTARPLRHMVIVGSSRQLSAASLLAPDKFCNHEVVIPSNGEPNSARGTAVMMQCATLRIYYTEIWTAYYCSPGGDHSDADEKAALRAVATDPAVAALVHDDPGDSASGPRGPYFVNVKVGAE